MVVTATHQFGARSILVRVKFLPRGPEAPRGEWFISCRCASSWIISVVDQMGRGLHQPPVEADFTFAICSCPSGCGRRSATFCRLYHQRCQCLQAGEKMAAPVAVASV